MGGCWYPRLLIQLLLLLLLGSRVYIVESRMGMFLHVSGLVVQFRPALKICTTSGDTPTSLLPLILAPPLHLA